MAGVECDGGAARGGGRMPSKSKTHSSLSRSHRDRHRKVFASGFSYEEILKETLRSSQKWTMIDKISEGRGTKPCSAVQRGASPDLASSN